jgi:predicted oxidoreductase
MATWAAMEPMVAAGMVRSLGVSNFTVEQLVHLQTVAKVPISVNQVELHPYLAQQSMVDHCKVVAAPSFNSPHCSHYADVCSSTRLFRSDNRMFFLHKNYLLNVQT